MKRLLLKFLFTVLFLTLLISCKKEKQEIISDIDIGDRNNADIKSDPKNIYHSKYTNVVKIQGRYVEKESSVEYFSLGGREEGEYIGDDIFEAIRLGSLQRVIDIIEENNSMLRLEFKEEDYNRYNAFMANLYNMSNATTLMFAVFYRDMGIIKYLLDISDKILDDTSKKQYLLAVDIDGWNAFTWACAVGTVDIIKMLVEEYPDYVYWESILGATGLHMAASQGNFPVLDYLVKDLGMSVTAEDYDGDSVSDYAHFAQNEETLEAISRLEVWEKKNAEWIRLLTK